MIQLKIFLKWLFKLKTSLFINNKYVQRNYSGNTHDLSRAIIDSKHTFTKVSNVCCMLYAFHWAAKKERKISLSLCTARPKLYTILMKMRWKIMNFLHFCIIKYNICSLFVVVVIFCCLLFLLFFVLFFSTLFYLSNTNTLYR